MIVERYRVLHYKNGLSAKNSTEDAASLQSYLDKMPGIHLVEIYGNKNERIVLLLLESLFLNR